MFKRSFEAKFIQIALERVHEARPEFIPWSDAPQALHLELRDHEIGRSSSANSMRTGFWGRFRENRNLV
jgi:hypothetical protein